MVLLDTARSTTIIEVEVDRYFAALICFNYDIKFFILTIMQLLYVANTIVELLCTFEVTAREMAESDSSLLDQYDLMKDGAYQLENLEEVRFNASQTNISHCNCSTRCVDVHYELLDTPAFSLIRLGVSTMSHYLLPQYSH